MAFEKYLAANEGKYSYEASTSVDYLTYFSKNAVK